MNFLDPLFDKIPFLRDMEKRKRPIIAGFAVFVVMVLLGIIIDAIASSDGKITVVFMIIGFLLMAAVILFDFFFSKKTTNEDFNNNEGYPNYDELSEQSDFESNFNNFQQESYPEQYDGFTQDISPERFEVNDSNGFQSDEQFDYDDRHAQYSVNEPEQDDFRFHSDFDFADEPQQPEYDEAPVYPQQAPKFQPYQPQPDPVEEDYIGKPVMTFGTPSANSFDVAATADFVAPNISAPVMPDNIGGPVMSIPMRGTQPAVTETAPQQPVHVTPHLINTPAQPTYPQNPAYAQSQTAPVSQPYAQPQAAPVSQPYAQPQAAPVSQPYAQPQAAPVSQPYVPAYQQGERGQEIESFFDHMSEDELLYSDCVEVWASDAKPAAVRLLKQIESMPDKKKADALGREAEYLNAMLDRIYYFTMLDSINDNLNLKKYNFSVMVKECLRRFSPFFMEKRIGLLWKGLDIEIVTDKRWLIFALTQVIFNAVEFTGLGGKIAISAKKEGSMIHLMVDDNGCGISPDDLPHIFMAGFMGDNVPNEAGRRTGMGLFITRSVIEKLGGTVTAESTVDKGTRITIILPDKI